jgi:hypothetical protein
MAFEPERDEPRSALGRIDPFCWLAVGSMLLLAVVFTVGGVPTVGIPIGVVALIVLGFDSWVNRDDGLPPVGGPPTGFGGPPTGAGGPPTGAGARRGAPGARPRGARGGNPRAGHGY